jgi:hypothetical protein
MLPNTAEEKLKERMELSALYEIPLIINQSDGDVESNSIVLV